MVWTGIVHDDKIMHSQLCLAWAWAWARASYFKEFWQRFLHAMGKALVGKLSCMSTGLVLCDLRSKGAYMISSVCLACMCTCVDSLISLSSVSKRLNWIKSSDLLSRIDP